MDALGLQDPGHAPTGSPQPPRGGGSTGAPLVRLRIAYRKGGDLRFLSHLDLVRTFERALRRSGLPIAFSQGFNPRIRLSFPGALSTGIESECEEFDVVLTAPVDPEAAAVRLRECMPRGLDVLEVRPSKGGFQMPGAVRYELRRGDAEPLSEAQRSVLTARTGAPAARLRVLRTDEWSVRVAVFAGEGGGTALLRDWVASLEEADRTAAPMRIRKLPSDPNEEPLDWKPNGIEQSGKPLDDEPAGGSGDGRRGPTSPLPAKPVRSSSERSA